MGDAVLLHTGWDAHWGTDAYVAGGHPHLTADGTRPAHTTLLAAGVPIMEHLCGLEALPPSGFRFHAAPPMLTGMGTFPVRAYAVVGSARP